MGHFPSSNKVQDTLTVPSDCKVGTEHLPLTGNTG